VAASAHKKTRRGFRPGFLHSLFRLRYLAHVAFQVNGYLPTRLFTDTKFLFCNFQDGPAAKAA
jgi:hypothetical protein